MSRQASITIRQSLRLREAISVLARVYLHRSEGSYICLAAIFPPHLPELQDKGREYRWDSEPTENEDRIQVSEWRPAAQAPISG